jgi:hypothetical protein
VPVCYSLICLHKDDSKSTAGQAQEKELFFSGTRQGQREGLGQERQEQGQRRGQGQGDGEGQTGDTDTQESVY